jgi:hypothetical protein
MPRFVCDVEIICTIVRTTSMKQGLKYAAIICITKKHVSQLRF